MWCLCLPLYAFVYASRTVLLLLYIRSLNLDFVALQVPGGDPLLKLLAVDWLQSESRIDAVATNKNSMVQVTLLVFYPKSPLPPLSIFPPSQVTLLSFHL